jgi:hypothetical protein
VAVFPRYFLTPGDSKYIPNRPVRRSFSEGGFAASSRMAEDRKTVLAVNTKIYAAPHSQKKDKKIPLNLKLKGIFISNYL